MSAYETLMLGMEAANTSNLRRTTAMVEELTAQHANAEARRVQIEALRNTVFSAAKVIAHAADVLPASPVGAYYLARRTAQVFGGRGISDSTFGDLQDKTFAHATATRCLAVENQAREQIQHSESVAVDQLIWLDIVIPLMRTYLTWRDIERLIESGRSLTPKSMFGAGPLLVVFLLLGFVESSMRGHEGLAILLIAAGYYFFARARRNRSRSAIAEAQQIATRGGETFPTGTTDEQVRASVKDRLNALAHGGLAVDPAHLDTMRVTLDQYLAERASIWGRLFPTLGHEPLNRSLPV